MKRITPEAVVDAYISTGMYPAFRRWTTRDKKGGCGLSVLGYSQGCACSSGSRMEHYARKFDLHRYYVFGFVAGFDRPKKPMHQYFSKEATEYIQYSQGHADGVAARAAIKAHFGKGKKAKSQERPLEASGTVLEPVCS